MVIKANKRKVISKLDINISLEYEDEIKDFQEILAIAEKELYKYHRSSSEDSVYLLLSEIKNAIG